MQCRKNFAVRRSKTFLPLFGTNLAILIHDIPAQADKPIILLSSLGGFDKTDPAFIAANFQCVLSKPMKASALLSAMVEAITGETTVVSLPASKTSPSQFEQKSPELSAQRILLAEDNATNRKVCDLILQRMGYHADFAGNGVEVLNALEGTSYDVVLMDVEMPEMDGLEATRRIRDTIPADRQPWIIGVTANAMSGDSDICFKAGMDGYVAKPVRPAELAQALEMAKGGDRAEADETPSGGPLPEKSDTPSIDRAALDQLQDAIGGDPSLLDKLFQSFLDDCPLQLETINRNLPNGSVDDVRRAAHSVKASANDFGATHLAQIAGALENAVRQSGSIPQPYDPEPLWNAFAHAKTELLALCRRAMNPREIDQ